MIFTDTIILSDLHLGSEVSRASEAMRLLKTASFNRLILLGDIFSDLNFRRLKKEHWRFLGYIRKLSNPKREIEVVWVEGNHDHGLSQVMSHLVGIRVYQEYVWEYGGVRHLAVHGHQFDRFLTRNLAISRSLSALHLAIQKFALGRQRMIGFLERFDTAWLRLSAKVADGAIAHGRSRDVQRVFCGHTHEALSMTRDGVEYYNSGSWTQEVPTYIAIDQRGPRICEYREPAEESLGQEVREDLEMDFEDLLSD
ncbi:MAG: UDP-2,3-diacylglucosamine diphosphatase [Acidobacteria bacterium]|nr:MAG: UDP-2,3-diacylglucosamine diphosphatase [Acidobacteriota bacterium]PYV76652.1 MAG: UDP-2,3-diacylglucosamine diphosphatase [Acidobacteriota bacterium]